MNRLGISAIIIASIAGMTGCTSCRSKLSQPGEGSAQVTYRPEVKPMQEQAALKALRGVSTNGLALVFDARDSSIAALRPGDVLLVKNRMARKVLAVDQQGNEKIILTRVATLPEVATKAKISFHQPVHFGSQRADASPALQPWYQHIFPTLGPSSVHAQSQSQAERDDAAINSGINSAKNGANTVIKNFHAVVDGWDTEFDATPEDGKLHLTIKLSRTTEATNVVATIDGDGYLQDYETTMDAAMSGGSMSDVTGSFKNINGSMNLTWKIGQKVAGGATGPQRIDFPTVVKTSLAPLLDGLPLFLEINGAVIVNPVTTGGKEYASGSYHLTYDGYQNFKLHGTSFESEGPANMKIEAGQPVGISLAPNAAVVSLAAPIVQITFGGPALDVFKVGGLADASDTVDKWADKVAKEYLPPDAYKIFQDTTDLLNQALKAVKNTGAMVDMRVVTTTTYMQSGAAIMYPCMKETWQFLVYVGASAQALGVPAGNYTKKIGEKEFHRVIPPNAGLCGGT